MGKRSPEPVGENFSIHWFIHGYGNAIVIVRLPDKYIHLSLSLCVLCGGYYAEDTGSNKSKPERDNLLNQNRTVSEGED